MLTHTHNSRANTDAGLTFRYGYADNFICLCLSIKQLRVYIYIDLFRVISLNFRCAICLDAKSMSPFCFALVSDVFLVSFIPPDTACQKPSTRSSFTWISSPSCFNTPWTGLVLRSLSAHPACAHSHRLVNILKSLAYLCRSLCRITKTMICTWKHSCKWQQDAI